MTARKAAIKLIYKYVQRGDTIAQLREGQQGEHCHDYSVAIGGYMKGKYVRPDWIVISRLNGRPYSKKFKLADIYLTIRRGATP